MRELYPEIQAYDSGYLAVSELHTLYYEQVGNPTAKPALFLHGGPGSGIDPVHRRFFNPEKYRVVLFDQRGCGKSTPYAELRENTTQALADDIERLRQHLGIEQWLIFGGSWGSTLGLYYAIQYPERCITLILRGIFLCRAQDILWFYQQGAGAFFPAEWQTYQNFIVPEARDNFVTAYYHLLNDTDPLIREHAAQHWCAWESSVMKLIPTLTDNFRQPQPVEAFARIENYYMYHRGFLPTDNYFLEQLDKIKHLPCVIIHGRYDLICSLEGAWTLAQAWGTQAHLSIIEGAGHSASEVSIASALIDATDAFSR